jgi:hypothetical protein
MQNLVFAMVLLCTLSMQAAGQLIMAQSDDQRGDMSLNIMNEDRFWAIIDKTTPYESERPRQLQALKAALIELDTVEIEAFERAFHRAQRKAYTWDLWGAAYVIHGGAGDDGFEYFQRWLISRGRKVFEAAIVDPDSLADILPAGIREACEFEEFAYVAGKVWGEKSGIDPWKDPRASFSYTGMPPAASPDGTEFKEDSEYLSKRYPKLWTRFGASPLMD